LTALFNVLPVDLSFVDKEDIVRFFSGGERIFPRAKSVIGRRVIDCHPPKSMAVVEKILEDFKSGARDQADFWIDLHRFNKKVYIRYFAMRDEETGEYLGCLEVSQDITAIQNLVGEKRLDGHEKTTSEYENQVAKSMKKNTDKVASGEMPDFVKKMLADK
ncbi:PAS domain-containing protein, partial [Limosilactobacillus reuteri]